MAHGTVVFMELYSKLGRFEYEEEFRAREEWCEWYRDNVACSCCVFPSREWQENPRPLEVDVTGSFAGCTTVATGCPITLWREDLLGVLSEFVPNAVLGQCFGGQGGERTRLPFWTLQVARTEQVVRQRGPSRFGGESEAGEAGFYACPDCGRIQGFGDFSEGLVKSDVRDRPAVVDRHGSVLMDRRLTDELRLRERFDDLRLYAIPVMNKPADRWTLPNDPGWDGTLRPPPGFGKIPPFPCRKKW